MAQNDRVLAGEREKITLFYKPAVLNKRAQDANAAENAPEQQEEEKASLLSNEVTFEPRRTDISRENQRLRLHPRY